MFSAINYSSDNFSRKTPDLPLTDEPALNRLKSLGTGQKADMLEKSTLEILFDTTCLDFRFIVKN